MMFENILKKFAADLIPKLLPDILRSIADQIECGGTATVTEETVWGAMEAHDEHIKAVASEMMEGRTDD
jgi:hypothetical protein